MAGRLQSASVSTLLDVPSQPTWLIPFIRLIFEASELTAFILAIPDSRPGQACLVMVFPAQRMGDQSHTAHQVSGMMRLSLWEARV